MVRQWLMWVLCGGALAALVAAGLWGRASGRRLAVLGAWARRALPRPGASAQEEQTESAQSPGRHAPVRVANSAPLLRSPMVRRRVTQRRALLGLLGALSVCSLVAGAAIAARPVAIDEHNDALASRDIVLCLDVSTSMVTTDARILETFSAMVDSFSGERVALVAWNTTSQTMVPLTDDYDMLRAQLKEISDDLDFTPSYGNPALWRYMETFKGTLSDDIEASSLIGDGLASCTMAFDQKVSDRPRSIVLASDNQVQDPYGLQIYSLKDAAGLVAEEDIRLFSIYGADPQMQDPDTTNADMERARQELQSVTTERDGLFYEVDDASAASQIVEAMEEKQAKEALADTIVERTDTPQVPAAILLTAVLSLLVLTAWRRA